MTIEEVHRLTGLSVRAIRVRLNNGQTLAEIARCGKINPQAPFLDSNRQVSLKTGLSQDSIRRRRKTMTVEEILKYPSFVPGAKRCRPMAGRPTAHESMARLAARCGVSKKAIENRYFDMKSFGITNWGHEKDPRKLIRFAASRTIDIKKLTHALCAAARLTHQVTTIDALESFMVGALDDATLHPIIVHAHAQGEIRASAAAYTLLESPKYAIYSIIDTMYVLGKTSNALICDVLRSYLTIEDIVQSKKRK